MKFLRKISKFQVNQAYKTKKIFFQNFYFLFKLIKLRKREYAWEISSLHTEDRTENCARNAVWNDFPQESIKKAVLVSRKRLQACIRVEVNTLSTYFHSNQHSLPLHKNLPFQGRHIILKKSLEANLWDILTTVRYFCTIFVRLIEEIFSHVSTKFYCKILKSWNVMKFLWKISKFQINQAYKKGIWLRNIKPTYRSRKIR